MANPNNRGRLTEQQKVILLEFIEVNPGLNTGLLTATFTAADKARLWTEITEILNSCGGANKNEHGWKGCWGDLKSSIKKKISRIKDSIERTGGGWASENPLTDLESRIAGVMGESVIFGLRGGHDSQVTVPESCEQQESENREPAAGPTSGQQLSISVDKEGCFRIPENLSFPMNLRILSNELETQNAASVNRGSSDASRVLTPKINNSIYQETSDQNASGVRRLAESIPRLPTSSANQGSRKNLKRVNKSAQLDHAKEMVGLFATAQERQAQAIQEMANISREMLELKKRKLETAERLCAAEERKADVLEKIACFLFK